MKAAVQTGPCCPCSLKPGPALTRHQVFDVALIETHALAAVLDPGTAKIRVAGDHGTHTGKDHPPPCRFGSTNRRLSRPCP